MQRTTKLYAIILACGLSVIPEPLLAAASTFVGVTTNGNWSNPANWQSGTVPGAGDDIIVADTTATNSFYMNDGVHTIGLLQFGTTGTRANPSQPQFILNGNTTANTAYALTITNGVVANGNFNVSGTAGFQTKLPLIVQGDQTWSIGGNAGSSTADYGLMLTVGANGTQRALILNGTLTKVGSGQLGLVGIINTNGDIVVNAGSLKFNAGSSTTLSVGGSGNITVNSGGSIFYAKNSGTLNITKAVTLNSGATLRFGGNSATLNSVGSAMTFNGTVPIIMEYASLNLDHTNTWSGTINSTITGTGGTNTFWANNSGLSGTINNNAVCRIRFGSPNAASPNVAYGLNNASAIYEICGPATSLEFGSLGGTAGTVRNGNTNSLPATLTVGGLNTTTTFGGVLADLTAGLNLVKVGTGTMTLTGANTYSGTTTVSRGTLLVSGSTASLGAGGVAVRSGATFGGDSAIVSSVVSLDSGATLQLNGGIGTTPLSLQALTFGAGSSDVTTSAVSLYLGGSATVGGAVVVNGTNIVNIVGAVPGVGVYDLIAHPGGPLGGAGLAGFVLGSIPFGVVANLQDTGTSLQLNITAITVEDNIWTGAAQSIWSLDGTLDWKGAIHGTAQAYHDLYPAFFDDSASSFFVNLTTNVYPALVSVNNSTIYTFTNNGGIQGSTSLIKTGPGTLVLANNNAFTGGTFITNGVLQIGLGGTSGTISGFMTNGGSLVFNRADSNAYTGNLVGVGNVEQRGPGQLLLNGGAYSGNTLVSAGTLVAGSGSALGDTNGFTTVATGATLDVNGQNLDGEYVTVSGSGATGSGAIVNNGIGDQQNAFRYVTLTGDTVFGGAFRWDIRNPNAANDPTGGNSAFLLGSHFNLTKVGSNNITLISVGETSLGNIDVQSGTLTFSRSTTLGDPAKRLTLWPGATVQLHRTSEYEQNVLNKVVSLTNATLAIDNSSAGLTNWFYGTMTLNGASNIINLPSATGLVLEGPINGAGSNTIVGPGMLTLTNVANYSGGTTLSGGILVVDGSLGTGATPLQILGVSTLAGYGTIKDQVTVPSGCSLNPGDGGVGTLTINNQLVLAGGSTTVIKTFNDGFNTNSDAVAGLTKVTYGGTLVVTNLASLGSLPWAPAKYKVFTASSYAGSFAAVLPATPGPGLLWYTNNLPVDGTLEIRVLPTPNPPLVCSVSSLTSNSLNVVFNQEVEDNTADNPANYAFVGAGMPNIVSAQKSYAGSGNFDLSPTNIVLTLDGPITNTYASTYTLHVQNVRNTSYVPDTMNPTNVVGHAFGFDQVYYIQVTNGLAFAYGTNINIYADGVDIFNASDYCSYVCRAVSGDFDVSVNLSSFAAVGNDAGKAGIMARETTSPPWLIADRFVMMGAFPQVESGGRGQNFFQYRDTVGGNAVAPAAPRPTASYPTNWLRLKRTGSIFRGFASTNNLDWVLVNVIDVSTNTLGLSSGYADPILLGMVACSHVPAATTLATFTGWGTPGDRPTLTITNGLGSIGVSWPDWLTGTYKLQATPSLNPTVTWTNVPGSLNVNTVQLPPSSDGLYFRLAPASAP